MDFMFYTHILTFAGVLYLVYRDVKGQTKGMARSSSGQDSWFSSTQQGFDYPTGY